MWDFFCNFAADFVNSKRFIMTDYPECVGKESTGLARQSSAEMGDQ